MADRAFYYYRAKIRFLLKHRNFLLIIYAVAVDLFRFLLQEISVLKGIFQGEKPLQRRKRISCFHLGWDDFLRSYLKAWLYNIKMRPSREPFCFLTADEINKFISSNV